jgi:GNAT superfamily N-acetyltransferase
MKAETKGIRRVELLWDLDKPQPRPSLSDEVIVRRARKHDRNRIGKMIVQAYMPEWSWWVKQVGGKEKARIDLMRYVTDFLRHPRKRLLVAEVGNRIVGLCGAARYRNRTGTIGYGVAVLPEYRGRGIGSMLLSSAFNQLKKSGIRFVTLEDETFSFRNRDIAAMHVYKKFKGKVIRDILAD